MLDIATDDLKTIKAILARHLPGVTVWAFGSRVRETARPFSDLDLALITDTPISIAVYTELREAFSNSSLPFKVDLVDWAAIEGNFKKVIEEKYEVIQC